MNNGAASTGLTFTTGAITRTTSGAAVNFVAPAGTSVTLSGNVSNAFIGPWAFFNGANYAATNGSGVVQAATLASATGVNNFASATANYAYVSPGATDTQSVTAATANTVTFTTSSPQTISVPTSDTLTLSGMLNSGAALTISGSGQLNIGNTNELVIGGTGNVSIALPIANNGSTASALTACSPAVVTLAATNTYTGLTTVGAGTLQIGNGTTDGALSPTSTISIASGATLLYNYNSTGYSAGVAPVWANITGGGTLALESAKANDETLAYANYVTLPSAFTGTFLAESGRLVLVGSAAYGGLGNASTVIVQPGAQLGMWIGGTYPQSFIIAGTGCGDTGYPDALRMGNAGLNTIIAGNVTLAANATIGTYQGTATIAGVISGSSTANLTVGGGGHGQGTIIFAAANTFAGSTTLLAYSGQPMVLGLANSAALQNSTFIAGYAGSFGTLAFMEGFSGSAGTAAYSYNPAAFSNTYVLGGLSGSGNITLATSAATPSAVALVVGNNGQSTTYSGVLSDNGLGSSLTVIGGGLTLSGSNTYIGATTITAGTLQVGAGGSGASINSSNGVLDNGNLVFNHGDTVNFTPLIGGSGNLTQTGSGNLILALSEGYSGSTTIGSGGTLQLGTGGSGQDGTLATSGITDNGTLAYNLFGSQSPAYSISGSGSLAKLGTGLLTLGFPNSYSGATTVSAGTLQLANAAALTSTGNLTVNGGLLDLHGNSVGAAAFSGLAAAAVDNLAASSTSTLTVGNGNASGAYAGKILSSLGAINLVKTGSGTLVLTGTNLYTGTTTVNGGLLAVMGSNSSGGAYAINGGTLGGTGTITAAVTLNAGANLWPGAAGPSGRHDRGGLSVVGNGNTIGFDLTNSPSSSLNDEVAVKGTGDLSITVPTVIAVTLLSPALGTGSYPLFTYNTGTSPIFNTADLSLASSATVLTSRQTASFSASGGTVDLNIVGTAQTLTWNGSNSNTWDNVATNNTWINNASHADHFVVGDNVIFNNSASQTIVNVNDAVLPNTVLVTGSQSYAFSGSGSIGGSTTPLTMKGTGTLTVGTTGNTYGGGTFIQSGTLAIGASNALPTAGLVSLGSTGSSGTLDLDGYNQQVSGLTVGSGATPSAQTVGNSQGSLATLTVSGGRVDLRRRDPETE